MSDLYKSTLKYEPNVSRPAGEERREAHIQADDGGGAWKPALAIAGVERKRENGMHALRHHYASVLLESGVSIRAVSEYLGHHDPGFTLRTYAHLMPESEDRARLAIDEAHGAPAESTRNGIAVLT